MADNKDKKVLKSSIEREQSQTCLNSAEREKIKGSTNLNVPHLRFPEFSGEWEKKRFKDVCNITTGNKNTQDKSDDGIYPFYVRSQNVERINSWTFDGEAILTAGDGVGVGKVFHYSTGKIGVHQRVYILSDFKCDGKYLYSYFAGNFYNRVKRMSAKNSVDSVRMEMIADMPISLPSTMEQNKIGHLLALHDERIATQNKIIEKMESLIKGLSQRLLSPKQGWTSYKLDELCQIKSGYSGIQVSFQTAYKVSRIGTISNHCINMSRIGFVKEIPQEYKLSVGDILFSNINSVQYIGNTAFIDKDYGLYHGMNLLRIVPDSRIVFPRFIHLLLCSERLLRHFQSICNKAVSQASINQTSLGKTIMTIPSYKEQQHICCIIESVERKLDIETSLLKMLQYQKQYLLRQMFI